MECSGHTNVPRIKECEDGTDGKDVVELRKSRHLDGVEVPVDWLCGTSAG
jgi:hypothetical protein